MALPLDLVGPAVLGVPAHQPPVAVPGVHRLRVHPGHGRDRLVVPHHHHLEPVAGPVVEEVDVAGERDRDQLVAGAAERRESQ